MIDTFLRAVKTAIKVKCQCVSTAKHGNLVGLLRFSPSFLFACPASTRANLAFKTTNIEDTHLTLGVNPFKVEANNSLIFCHYKHMRKNLPSFRSYNFFVNVLVFVNECISIIKYVLT